MIRWIEVPVRVEGFEDGYEVHVSARYTNALRKLLDFYRVLGRIVCLGDGDADTPRAACRISSPAALSWMSERLRDIQAGETCSTRRITLSHVTSALSSGGVTVRLSEICFSTLNSSASHS